MSARERRSAAGRSSRVLPAAGLALALLTAACVRSGSEVSEQVAASAGSPGPPSATGAATVDAPPGRLLVVGGDGNLVTMLPDGSDRITLTEGASAERRFVQPTWSPDGTRVAWTELTAGAVPPEASVVTSRADGTDRTAATTDVAAFYLSWDPRSSRIAYLGGSDELEMGTIDVEAGGTRARPLDSGRPYYLSWAPEGDRLIVHVGRDRLDELDLRGRTSSLTREPGVFRAPVWSARGDLLVYSVGHGDRQTVVVGRAGARTRPVLDYAGLGEFVLSPDASRLAFQSVSVLQGAAPPREGNVPTATDRVLSVLDLRGGKIEEISSGRVAAFFWSPTGDHLMFLRPELAGEEFWLRWNVWDGTRTFETARFRASEVFVQGYLPFFDQYAQSHSPWAPDGSAFAYAGRNERGETGVWVQRAEPDAPPVLVSDGDFVVWSPA